MRGRISFLLPIALSVALLQPIAAAETKKAPETKSENNGTKEIKTLPIEITGLKHLDPDEVYSVLGVPVRPWFEFWKSDEKRIPVKLIPAISDTLRGFLDSKGYYDATYTVDVRPDKVLVRIHEGKPVTVADINISSDFPIRDYVTFKKGEPFETERFTTIKSQIRKALLKEGYCSYDLDTKAYIDLDKRTVDLVYRLKKGDLCHFGNTTVVEKPEGIRDAVILSRMRYLPGDVFTTERVNESYAALNSLGIFGQTLIDTEKKYFNVVRPEVHAKLKEKMHRYTLSAGYDTEVGFRVKGTYDHYNLFGGGRKGGIVAQYSSEVKELTANFFQPAIFDVAGRYFDFYSEGGYYEEVYDYYDEKKIYLDLKFSHVDGFWSYDLGFDIERINIVLTGNPGEEDNLVIPGYFSLVYGYGRITYDGRDSKLDPRNGYYLSGYFEYGYSMGVEENDPYYKLELEARYIKSFGKLTLATVGHAGVLDDGAVASLPASKYFYAGGSFSNRAYGDRDIGITETPTVDWGIGGRTWLNFTAEAQYPIWGDLYGGVFYDATLISEDIYSIGFSSWVQSAGVGIRYMTPVGPLKIDFAANIHDPSINRASLMIGQSF
ncbi:autotransporter assembly complex protein TamA [Nitratifractor sp.]